MNDAPYPLRVLVVEDELLYAEQLEQALKELGYEVVGPAHSAAAALALVRKASIPPDVALLDIQLGQRGPDGIELARQLLAEWPLPLIFLTSQADTASFERSRPLGPAAYLVKPADPAALQRAIELAVVNFASRLQPGAPAEEDADSPLFSAPGTGNLLPHALFVKEAGLLVKIVVADISWIVAEGKHCRLALSGGRVVPVRQPLREISQHLPAGQFVQIQRSYLVNAECIERIDPVRNIAQVGGQLLPIGLVYRDKLLERLHLV